MYSTPASIESVAIDKYNANNDTLNMVSIAILAVKDCLLSGVVGPLEIFTIANGIADTQQHAPVLNPVEVIGISQEKALNFVGFPLSVQATIFETTADILIIPPIFGDVDPFLANRTFINQIRSMQENGTIIATCCAGSFLLAETGFLDGKTATTHWNLIDRFRARFPKVDLQPQMMLIDGGNYICAGGAMAWQDLALHIVARFMDSETASRCAKLLVMDGTRHVQTPYFMFEQLSENVDGHSDLEIESVRKWIQRNYHTEISLQELAERANCSVRTFLRRFKRATGQTPLNYLQQLRVEAARHLLEVSTKNIEEITGLTGYSDSSSFRRLFKKKTGLTPKEYRTRFNRLQP